MKLLILEISLSVIWLSNSANAGDVDCKKVPITKMGQCCTMPEFASISVVTAAVTEVQKENLTNDALVECKIKQKIGSTLNVTKNGIIDYENCKKYLDVLFRDSEWLKPAQDSLKECIKIVAKFAPVVQNMVKFPKETCDVTFNSLTQCTEVSLFTDCPKDHWTEKAECSDGRKFVKACHDNVEQMIKFIRGQDS